MDSSLSVDSASIIPSELTGPLPRRLQTTGSGIYSLIVSTVVLAFTVLMALWGAKNTVQQIEHRAAIRRDGVETVGEVTRIWKGRHASTIDYTFTMNGTLFTGKAELPWQLQNDVERSNSLNIRYTPMHPEINHPAAWEWSFIRWLPLSTDLIHVPDFSAEFGWLFGSLMWGSIGLVYLIALGRERTLVAEGVPATAVVTKCSPPKGRSGIVIKYEFRTLDGRVINGRSGGYDRLREIGANICILYLPQNPKRNQTYPSRNFRVAQ